MFDSAKKFVQKHKYKFIIAGIAVAGVGAFLAWFVNLAFLAMIFLSLIWSGYFYSLGADQPLDKNETNEKESGENLGVPEGSIQTQETNKELQMRDINNSDSKHLTITEDIVKDLFKQKADLNVNANGIPNLIDKVFMEQFASTNDGSFYVISLLEQHFSGINWRQYSLPEILSQVKQIIAILSNHTEDEISAFLDDNAMNKEVPITSVKFSYALDNWPAEEPGAHMFSIDCVQRTIEVITENYNKYQEQNKKPTDQPLDKNETNEKESGENLGVPECQMQIRKNIIEYGNDNIQEAQIDSSYVPITKELVYGYISEMINIGFSEAMEQNSPLVTAKDGGARLRVAVYCVLTLHFQKIPWQTYSLDQIIFDVKSIVSVLTGIGVDNIEKDFNKFEHDSTKDELLWATTEVEEQLKKFDTRDKHNINISDLDKLIKKIGKRYQVEINTLKKSSPNLEAAPGLNNLDL